MNAAADERKEPVSDIDLRGSDCIWIRTIRDYTPLSNDSLLIHASGKRSYFVTLMTPASGVSSWTIQRRLKVIPSAVMGFDGSFG